MESILEVLTPDNLVFIFKGFGLTLYISLIAIILSTIIHRYGASCHEKWQKSCLANHLQYLYRVCAQRSQPSLDFYYLFGVQNEIHTSRYYSLYSLYISSLG
ncbi:ABC-type amino acid transporter, membrane-spanning permease [Streptococcus pneumoniae]|nr:ABC-type amino acid transporter, membrane-spanning permease [Streptococcus pneumoniae]